MSDDPNEIDAEQRHAEQLLTAALRELPNRRAPATLESRVLARIEQCARLPWWRSSFARWPSSARIAFGVVCVALIAVSALSSGWVAAEFGAWRTSGALSPPWLQEAEALIGVTQSLSSSLAHLVAPDWLYGGLIAGATLYAALFGLLIAGYRMLYVRSDS
jgi:hypothetical protein